MSYFAISSLTAYEKAIYGWIRLIVFNKIPIATVENNEAKRWFKFEVNISQKLLWHPFTVWLRKLSVGLDQK